MGGERGGGGGGVFNNNYKLFDKLDAFSFFIVHMLYTDSDIPKSIIYSALVGEFLRIVPLLYKRLQWKSWRKALSKIIQRQKNVCQFQKKLRWNSFWSFNSNYIKFAIWQITHCQQPYRPVIYIFDAWNFVSSVPFFIHTISQ